MASELIPKPPFPMQCWVAIGIFTILTILLFVLNHYLKNKDPKKKKKSNKWVIFLIVVSIICLTFTTIGCVWFHKKTVQVWESTVGVVDTAVDDIADTTDDLVEDL